MARTTRTRRKMANTTGSPSSTGSLLSTPSTTPFTTSTTATYSTEGYIFNYSGLASQDGYLLNDMNYTELWVDVWNSTEASNITERLNVTILSAESYCDEWESAQHKLFQVINVIEINEKQFFFSNNISIRRYHCSYFRRQQIFSSQQLF